MIKLPFLLYGLDLSKRKKFEKRSGTFSDQKEGENLKNLVKIF